MLWSFRVVRRGVLTDAAASVQKTVRENLNGGEIKNISKEKEDGIEQYEIESVLNGQARDFNVDVMSTLVVMEEATTIDAISAAAKAGILKKVGACKLTWSRRPRRRDGR